MYSAISSESNLFRLRGHRITVAQVLAEIADSSVDDFCKNFDISKDKVDLMLRELSHLLDKHEPMFCHLCEL